MAKKKVQPKTFSRGGEFALAYSPADEVRLVYNGWSEVKPAEPPAPDATADADTTDTGKAKAAPKKAS